MRCNRNGGAGADDEADGEAGACQSAGAQMQTAGTGVEGQAREWQSTEVNEDIISLDMIMLLAFKPKVQSFYVRIIVVKLDELMLHHEVVRFQFRNIYMY